MYTRLDGEGQEEATAIYDQGVPVVSDRPTARGGAVAGLAVIMILAAALGGFRIYGGATDRWFPVPGAAPPASAVYVRKAPGILAAAVDESGRSRILVREGEGLTIWAISPDGNPAPDAVKPGQGGVRPGQNEVPEIPEFWAVSPIGTAFAAKNAVRFQDTTGRAIWEKTLAGPVRGLAVGGAGTILAEIRVPADFTVPADLTAALGSGSRASEEVASRGEALVLIDQQGKTQATIPIPGVATAFASFQDGQNLALAAVIPGNPPRGTLYLRNPDGRLASLESAPGKIYHRLAAGKAGELFAATGKQVRAYAPGGRLTWTAHLDAAVTALAPAPGGGVFAAGSRQLILFDSTGSIAWRARLPGKVLGLAPAGEYLQVLGRDEIRVYRLAPRRSKGRAD